MCRVLLPGAGAVYTGSCAWDCLIGRGRRLDVRLYPATAMPSVCPVCAPPGHAGVFATAALCFNAALHYEERRGRLHLASGGRRRVC